MTLVSTGLLGWMGMTSSPPALGARVTSPSSRKRAAGSPVTSKPEPSSWAEKMAAVSNTWAPPTFSRLYLM